MITKKHAVLGLVATTAAAFLLLHSRAQSQSDPTPQYRLGGAFIGTSSGGEHIWNAFQIPLDPAGRTAALKVSSFTYPPALAGLLTACGADSLGGDGTGQMEMINRDTAKYRFVHYAVKQGNPPVIKLIFVWSGTIQFTGPDSGVLTINADVYPAAADADKDGLPDPGSTPLLSLPPVTGTAKRITP